MSAAFDNQYREHQVMWNLFPKDPDGTRDFLFRFLLENRLPVYYVLSKRAPVETPRGWQLDGPREFKPVVKKGMQFGFSLRVNPVITKKDPEAPDSKIRLRHDVVMDLRNKWKDSGKPRTEWPSILQIATEAGAKWLLDRMETFGFFVDSSQILVEGYTRMQFRKSGREKPIKLGVLDYSGVLTVGDTEKFNRSLFNGIGHAKGFGCGLLLIKPLN